LTIFGRNVTEKRVRNQKMLYCQPHLTSASALPGERGNLGTAVFHCKLFARKHTKTHLKTHLKYITWSQPNHPSLSKWSTVCTRRDLQYMSPSRSKFTKSVTVPVALL